MSAVLGALALNAELRPNAVALVSGERRIRYAQLYLDVEAAAQTLALALREGDGCVAIALDNGAAWVVADLALASLGRAVLPIPPFFTPAQVKSALKDAGADWILAPQGDGAPLMLGGEAVWLNRLDGDAQRLPAGTAKVTYTSGSTASPKGVCLSRAHMERVARSIVERFGVEFADRHAALLPLSVLLENVAGLYAILLAGGCYIAEAAQDLGCANPFKPDFARMGAALTRVEATSLILVPELLRGIVAARAAGQMSLPPLGLVAVGGAKAAPDLIMSARALGLPTYEGYGLTECASVVAVNAPGADRVGTVGRPLAHGSLSIAEDGEVIVAGDTFLGYSGDASRSSPLHTGDLGVIDEDGFLTIAGRKDNRIVTSFGRNVAPEWIESELMTEPAIGHALVFGEGQAELGALIAPARGDMSRAEAAASIARVNARLPAYARIGRFALIAPLSFAAGELTGNGRVRRQALLAAHAAFVKG